MNQLLIYYWYYILLLVVVSSIYLHVLAFQVGRLACGSYAAKILGCAITGAALGGPVWMFIDSIAKDSVSDAFWFAVLARQAPERAVTFGLPFAALAAYCVTSLSAMPRPIPTEQVEPGRRYKMLHLLLPRFAMSMAASTMWMTAFRLHLASLFIGGGLAHVHVEPWALPRFTLASLLATGMAGYAWRRELPERWKSALIRTGLVVLTAAVVVYVALREL